jgi:hypothetical protein
LVTSDEPDRNALTNRSESGNAIVSAIKISSQAVPRPKATFVCDCIRIASKRSAVRLASYFRLVAERALPPSGNFSDRT